MRPDPAITNATDTPTAACHPRRDGSWIRRGPVPIWAVTTLGLLLLLQWSLIAVIAVRG